MGISPVIEKLRSTRFPHINMPTKRVHHETREKDEMVQLFHKKIGKKTQDFDGETTLMAFALQFSTPT